MKTIINALLFVFIKRSKTWKIQARIRKSLNCLKTNGNGWSRKTRRPHHHFIGSLATHLGCSGKEKITMRSS